MPLGPSRGRPQLKRYAGHAVYRLSSCPQPDGFLRSLMLDASYCDRCPSLTSSSPVTACPGPQWQPSGHNLRPIHQKIISVQVRVSIIDKDSAHESCHGVYCCLLLFRVSDVPRRKGVLQHYGGVCTQFRSSKHLAISSQSLRVI